MLNYLENFTENRAFGTTELCRYCGMNDQKVKIIKLKNNNGDNKYSF